MSNETEDRNGNSNCMRGMQCPKCGNAEHIGITIKVTQWVWDHDLELGDSGDWEEDNECFCPHCDFTGTVKDFSFDADAVHLCPECRSTDIVWEIDQGEQTVLCNNCGFEGNPSQLIAQVAEQP